MSIPPRSYRFATSKQWQSGLFHLADAAAGLTPMRPFARIPELFASPGGAAPTPLLTRQIVWRDDNRVLHLLSTPSDIESFPAPPGVATSPRLIADIHGIWAIGTQPGSLLCYEPGTMTRLVTLDIPGARLVDLAFLSCDVIGVLAETETGWHVISIGCNGDVLASEPLLCLQHPVACAFLRSSRQLVVLTGGEHPRLHWFSLDGGVPASSLSVALRFPCCRCSALAGDDRIYIAASSGGQNAVLVLDAEGTLIDTVPVDPMDAPITGLAAATANLYLTGPRGLLRYATADTVPAGATEIICSFLTPVLQSPDPEGTSPWLRAEVLVSLPDGCAIEISVAATNDPQVRDRLAAIAGDTRIPPGRRIQNILGESDIWQSKVVFHGESPSSATVSLAAPLFDVAGRYLWISVMLTAPSESQFPSIAELNVLYPGHGLMENLPAVYRFDKLGGERIETRADGFARYLVGVLETTTQGLDASISALGSRINPATAPEEWLNYIARWLGLPWDDALTLEQKGAIVLNAAELARQRGTRGGLETLLQSLVPGTPPRYRIVDATADFGFAVLGCDSGPGSALPAMLGGFGRDRAELGPRSILGVMRLPCPNRPDDPTSRWLGRVRVDIAATAAEKSAWGLSMEALLSAMVPAAVTLTLRWISLYVLKSAMILDESLVLELAPLPHLGTDAVTGLSRLPELKPRLSHAGVAIGGRLR